MKIVKTFFQNIKPLLHKITLSLLLAALTYNSTKAQFSIDEKTWLERMNLQAGLPDKLLSTRTVAFYD